MKYLLLDLNGTIHVGDTPTPGALAALDRLQKASQRGGKFKVRFCSNSSKESSASLISRLRAMSFSSSLIPSSDLFTSLDAARRLFSTSTLSSSSPSTPIISSSFSSAPLLLLSPSAQETFQDLPEAFHASPNRLPNQLKVEERERLRRCDSVVVGLAVNLMRYEWLDEAFRLLSGEYSSRGGSQSVRLIGTHRALYHRPGAGKIQEGEDEEKGGEEQQKMPLSLGPGAFLAALEEAAGLKRQETIIVGKPQWTFFEECLKGMGWNSDEKGNTTDDTDEVYIVGDDAVQDLSILTSTSSSIPDTLTMHRILVKTGKYRSGDEHKVATLHGREHEHENENEGGQRAGIVTLEESFAEWVDGFLASQPCVRLASE